jgi:predicted transcriptional regulator
LDLSKQYIIQCIISASNNLRLSSEKIEAVAILRERLNKAENLGDEIKSFKKITELSKLGVRLSELQSFIESGKIDFLKLSDKFKEHSYSLVKELSYVLDIVTPQMMRELFQKHNGESVNVDLTKRPANTEAEDKLNSAIAKEINIPKRSRADELKEEIIFEELNKEDNFSFEQYEAKVLRPIKELDAFLNRVQKYDYTENEMNSSIKLIKENGELSQKVGFEIISNMHKIIANGLDLVNQKKIAPSSNVIDSLRACLIVIVAVVRGKEVDITNYLNKAEEFGKTISQTKKVI